MTLMTEWRAISARIRSMTDLSEVLGNIEPQKLDDNRAHQDVAMPEVQEIRIVLIRFVTSYRSSLGTAAAEAIDRFMSRSAEPRQGHSGPNYVRKVLAALVVVRSELDYHLADVSANSRRITERAFLHLQRSIVANDDVQQQWKRAFDKGEVACEKLGAAHLLLHGIWAFKVHAEGERTDLVMNEPINDLTPVERVAEALVLTEWKKVVGPGDLDRKAAEARRQASRYGHGVLGGIELASYAYVVLVSEHHLAVEHLDRNEDDRRYVHVNVAVDPQSPSKT